MQKNLTQMQSQIPEDTVFLIRTLQFHGYEAVLVGGCVRDMLRGAMPADFDIATAAPPCEIARVFADKPLRRDGEKHGTVMVILHHKPFEITTYRIDGTYTDARHPDSVTFTSDLRADLSRRDFTVNAMAMMPDGVLFDPFDGQADLKQGVIRCVGAPTVRFTEDALRILRALRFSAVLGYAIAPETEQAIQSLYPLLRNVAKERIGGEFQKLLLGKQASRILQTYPEVFAHCAALRIRQDGLVLLDNAPEDVAVRLALIAEDTENAQQVAQTIRLSARLTKQTVALTRFRDMSLPETKVSARRILAALPPELSPELLVAYLRALGKNTVCDCMEDVLRAGDCFRMDMLRIDGEALRGLGIPQGKELGRILKTLLDGVIEGRIANDLSALRQAALCLHDPDIERKEAHTTGEEKS